jgi:hypothetical protein
MSFLPEDLGSYKQAPYESCTKEEFEALAEGLSNIDLRNVIELSDMTNLTDQQACMGSSCDIV